MEHVVFFHYSKAPGLSQSGGTCVILYSSKAPGFSQSGGICFIIFYSKAQDSHGQVKYVLYFTQDLHSQVEHVLYFITVRPKDPHS